MYRPDQRRSCCPHYTIRLDSGEFRPSRDQRQTVNRFNKYILGEKYIKEAARLYPRSKEETKTRNNEFVLVDRVREAEYGRLATPPEPAHKLTVTLEPDTFTEEKFLVYDNYQAVVHKDGPEDRTRTGFKRFLCSSPLKRHTVNLPNGRQQKLGSYHQCYRIDGKLVAIGVLDLLPQCVSSVYFLYHESIHKYAPGKLGAVHEIALALDGGYRWWYPGFYIHSCPKMRYKMDYTPQYILDPESLSWDPLDQTVLELLDKKPFVSLSLERAAQAQASQELNGSLDATKSNPENDNDDSMDDDQDGGDGEDMEPLLQSSMPGLPSILDMEDVDMDQMRVKAFGRLFETSDLVGWAENSVTDWPSLKASVAELVAAMGPDLKESICLDLSQGN